MENMKMHTMFGQEQMPCPEINQNSQSLPNVQAYPRVSLEEISPPMASSRRSYRYPTSIFYEQQQLYDQYWHEQNQQRLENYWVDPMAKVDEAVDFKSHPLPLAPIKRIMRADEDVRMIAAETPVLFAKACEMFILDLTRRAWKLTGEYTRKTLNMADIFKALRENMMFDFLDDIVPLDDASGSRSKLELETGTVDVEDPNTTEAEAFGSPIA